MGENVDTNHQQGVGVAVREFSDVVRCPHCTGFNIVSFEAWMMLREKEVKLGRCKHCERVFRLNITPWVFH